MSKPVLACRTASIAVPWPEATIHSMSPIMMTNGACRNIDDRALFEKLILDGFQAGLSWITILRKRDNFRRAFDDFDPEKIARYDETARSTPDEGCRHRPQSREDRRRHSSARAYLDIMEKGPGFSALLWDHLDGQPKVNHVQDHQTVPAETPLSRMISKELA